MKAPTTAPADLLDQVAAEQRTGALVAGGRPGGSVFVRDGQVTYAESPAAPGVGELLTASGRLSGHTWRSALDAGAGAGRVGPLLVEQGHLTLGELELCVLGATYDAAYFVLSPASAPAEFRPGATHWLGPVVRVDAAAVARETRRRGGLLDAIHPDARVDTAPVTPVARPPRERISLTAPQWELLVHADGQRTPADLALLLGRAGYATVQELRRLAALGLLDLPPEPDRPSFIPLPRTPGASADVHRPVPGTPPPAGTATTTPGTTTAGNTTTAGTAGSPPEQRTAPEAGPRAPRLARRKPGEKLPRELVADAVPIHVGTDEVLLKRIRTALRALR